VSLVLLVFRFFSFCRVPAPPANVVSESRAYANIVEPAIIGMNGIVGQRVLTPKFFCDLRQDLFKPTVFAAEHIVRYRVRPPTTIRSKCFQDIQVDRLDTTESTSSIGAREIGSRKNTQRVNQQLRLTDALPNLGK
jgi:hypothetical protein